MMRNFFKAVCPRLAPSLGLSGLGGPSRRTLRRERRPPTRPSSARFSGQWPSSSSMGSRRNVDESTYDTADWRIPLTHLGKQQACAAGDTIRELLERPIDGDDPDDGSKVRQPGKIFFYVSPTG